MKRSLKNIIITTFKENGIHLIDGYVNSDKDKYVIGINSNGYGLSWMKTNCTESIHYMNGFDHIFVIDNYMGLNDFDFLETVVSFN